MNIVILVNIKLDGMSCKPLAQPPKVEKFVALINKKLQYI